MNTSTSPLDCLQQALLISHRMLELAEKQAWADMQSLDQERMQWLQQAFGQGFPRDEQAQARVLAEQVQALNQQAMHKAEQALKQVRQSARDLQQNLKAARAYLENTEQAQRSE